MLILIKAGGLIINLDHVKVINIATDSILFAFGQLREECIEFAVKGKVKITTGKKLFADNISPGRYLLQEEFDDLKRVLIMNAQ